MDSWMIEFSESSCQLWALAVWMSLVCGCLVWFLNSNGRKKSSLTLWLFYKRAAALISCTGSLTADIFLLGFVFRQQVHVRAGQINKFVLCFTQSTNPIASCSDLFIYVLALLVLLSSSWLYSCLSRLRAQYKSRLHVLVCPSDPSL